MAVYKQLNTVTGLQFYQITRFAGLLLTGIILSKKHYLLSDISLYETFIFLSSALGFFWVNGFMQGMLAMRRHKQLAENEIITPAVSAMGAVSVFSFLLLLLNIPLIKTYTGIHAVELIFLFAGYFLANNFSMLTENVYVLRQKPKPLFIYALLSFFSMGILVIIPILLKYNMLIVIAGLFFHAVLKLLWTVIVLKPTIKWEFNRALTLDYLRMATPLIFASLLSNAGDYTDGFLVKALFPVNDFAIFRYGARELPLSVLLATGLGSALIPMLATQNIEKSCLELKERSLRLMHIVFPISIVLMLSSKWLYAVLYSPQFAYSASIFNIYLLLVLSRVVFPQTLIIAYGHTKIIYKIAAIEIIINVLSSYVLAQYFGLAGIAYGTLIAFFTDKIIYTWYVYVCLGVKPSQYISFGWWLGYSVMLGMIYCLIL